MAKVSQECVAACAMSSFVRALIALSDFPHVWETDATFQLDKANESESDEEGDGSDAEEEPKTQTGSAPFTNDRRSPGFVDFLQFLELGCGGSPLQGYPAVIVILSSIPSSVCACPFYSPVLSP